MNYNNTSKHYEKKKLENGKSCPICQGTKFVRMNGYIICCTCGLVNEVFCDTVYGFEEWTADDFDNGFIKALRELGDNGDKDDDKNTVMENI